MRDKSSGRSRGFAFVTFVVEDHENKGEKCQTARELHDRMLKPNTPHLVQNRAVEIRQSDGSKPQDSFIVKKDQNDDRRDNSRERDSQRNNRDSRREIEKRGDRKR